MKKIVSLVMLALLAACAQEVVVTEPAVYTDPEFSEPELVPERVIEPVEQPPQTDARETAVLAFLTNQEHDGLEDYVDSIRKNIDVSAGYMKDLLEKQEGVFADRLNYTLEWKRWYEKGKDHVAERTMENVDRIMGDFIGGREDTSLEFESIEIVSVKEVGNEAFVKTKTVEINNMPGMQGRRVLEDTYVLKNIEGEWKVVDVISNGERLSSTPLMVIIEPLTDENAREKHFLYDFRRVVGLSII